MRIAVSEEEWEAIVKQGKRVLSRKTTQYWLRQARKCDTTISLVLGKGEYSSVAQFSVKEITPTAKTVNIVLGKLLACKEASADSKLRSRMKNRFHQLKRGPGLTGGFEEFETFYQWYVNEVKKHKGQQGLSIMRIDKSRPLSPDNAFVARKEDAVIKKVGKVAPRIVEFRVGNLFSFYRIVNRKHTFSTNPLDKAVFLDLEEAKQAVRVMEKGEKRNTPILKEFYIGEHRCVVWDEGQPVRNNIKGMVDGYPVGWYASVKEAVAGIKEHFDEALYNLHKIKSGYFGMHDKKG